MAYEAAHEEATKNAPASAPASASPSLANSADELYVGDAVHFFLNSKLVGGRSQRTVEEYRKKLELFQKWAASRYGEGEVDLPIEEIDTDTIELYVVAMKDRGLSDNSRKNHLAVLRSFFDTLRRRKGLEDPVENLGEIRFHQKAPDSNYLTKREAGILLSAVERAGSEAQNNAKSGKYQLALRDHALISVMLYAGLRIEEATALRVEDLILRRGEERVRVARGKGNKERHVPMGQKLRRSIKRYLKVHPAGSGHLFVTTSGERISENTARRTLYKYVRQSGISKTSITPHDLRRTFATWYLQDNPGGHAELVRLMGHSDLSQVTKYALSDEERARAGVSRL